MCNHTPPPKDTRILCGWKSSGSSWVQGENMRLCGVGRGGKGSQGRRLRLGIWYMLLFIFSLVTLPQTESREKGRLAQTQTHTQRYFLLGVRGGQTVLWMTGWALKWAPFSSCSAPASSSSPSTIVQLCLVALTLGCLWFQRIYAHQGIIILTVTK